MKKRLLYLLLVPVLALVLLFTGCIPGSSSSSGGNTLESLAKDIVATNAKLTAAAAQLDTLQREVTAAGNVSQSLDNIQTAINGIKTDLTALTTRVATLEKGGSSSGSGGEKVEPKDAVKYSAQYSNIYTFPDTNPNTTLTPGATTQISIPIQLKLTNKLAADIENISLTVTFALYPDSSLPYLELYNALLVGDIDWQTNYVMDWRSFTSWSDVELDANDYDNFTLYYKPTLKNTSATDSLTLDLRSITVTLRFECTDYDMVK